MNDPAWTEALEGTQRAFKAVEGLSGTSDGYGNSNLLEVRNDLAFLLRRLTNLSLFHGVNPASVEEAKTQ
jgi:hypothetical protein